MHPSHLIAGASHYSSTGHGKQHLREYLNDQHFITSPTLFPFSGTNRDYRDLCVVLKFRLIGKQDKTK